MGNHTQNELLNVDEVPINAPKQDRRAKLLVIGDNEVVIKMVLKSRAATMRHVLRNNMIDLDWLIERFLLDTSIRTRYIGTKEQIADLFEKGQLTYVQWLELCRPAQVGQGGFKAVRKPISRDEVNHPKLEKRRW